MQKDGQIVDFKRIKKLFGEEMMHFCRSNFSTILERPGALSKLLEENFAPNKDLYSDIVASNQIKQFIEFIYDQYLLWGELDKTDLTPEELLNQKDYDFYECKTNDDIRSFKKYYAPGEELCSFKEDRIKDCYVFFAVKKDAENIKRKNPPDRDDEYGLSVISIQFLRGPRNFLSIKNRYNDTVKNADATCENNLDNINSGLTYSFEKKYGLNITQSTNNGLYIPNYVKTKDGKYYKYNYEIDDIFYCPNNIVIKDRIPYKYETEKYILADYYLIDRVSKTVILLDDKLGDCFVDGFTNIKKIDVHTEGDKKIITFTKNNNSTVIIVVDKDGKIIEFYDKSLTELKGNFMKYNTSLRSLFTPNVKIMGANSLKFNTELTEVFLDNLQYMGASSFYNNEKIHRVSFKSLIVMENSCFYYNNAIEELEFPNCKSMGNFNFHMNKIIKRIYAPKLTKMGNSNFPSNRCLKELELPSIEYFGSWNFANNTTIERIYAPKARFIGNMSFTSNHHLKRLDTPSLEALESGSFTVNNDVSVINAPKLKYMGHGCFELNSRIEVLNTPNLEHIDDSCFYSIDRDVLKEMISASTQKNGEHSKGVTR